MNERRASNPSAFEQCRVHERFQRQQALGRKPRSFEDFVQNAVEAGAWQA